MMNVTGFLVSLIVTLGYYLYTVRKERTNWQRRSVSGEQSNKINNSILNPKGGDR
jgi:hypothetical protein